MGCTVTSIYADQVIGKISYPEDILNDLAKRDFSQPCIFDKSKSKQYTNQVAKQIGSVYGFTQSYCQGYFFTTVFQQKQYLVYGNGRFVIRILKNEMDNIREGENDFKMNILTHDDQICCMDVNDNLCVVGVLGGKLILWDMKFDSVKIQINLPLPSVAFSSISLTDKYIFATDCSLPSNIAYCFDIQTTKLKASTVIPSLEPTLKGIKFQQNHHVIISAQGLWFMRYSQSGNILQVTKGMFTQFPKTSQCSIANMDNKYIISGGVDGYVYIWNDKYECIKVVRCFDQEQEITAVAYCRNHLTLIIGSIQGRIKCFAFDIKTKVKKPNVALSDEIKAQTYEDVEYSLSEAYEDEFGLQNIVVSKEDKLLYFTLNHSGRMMTRLLPSTQPYSNKLKALNNMEFMRYSRKGDISLNHQQDEAILKNLYPKSLKSFNLDILKLSQNKKWWTIQQKHSIETDPRHQSYPTLYTYCSKHQSVAYITQSNNVMVSFLKQKPQHQIQTKTEDAQKNSFKVCEVEIGFQIVGLNYLEVQIEGKEYVFLVLTLEDQCSVYWVKDVNTYELETNVKFLKGKFNRFEVTFKPNQHLVSDKNEKSTAKYDENSTSLSFQVDFDDHLKAWKQVKNEQKASKDYRHKQENSVKQSQVQSNQQSDALKNFFMKMHTAATKINTDINDRKLTVGGSSIILWKTNNLTL